MNKNEFLTRLSELLAPLDQMERVRMVQYYREIIEDRVEDGLTEEQAIEELEELEEIAARILDEMGPKQAQEVVYQPAQEKKRSGFSTVLLILGFPVWFPLLLAGGAVVLSMYVVVWALVISLYAVVVSLGAAGIAGVMGLLMYVGSNFMSGIFILGTGLFCAGLGVALFFPVCAAAKAMVSGSVRFGKWAFDSVFHRKGGAV